QPILILRSNPLAAIPQRPPTAAVLYSTRHAPAPHRTRLRPAFPPRPAPQHLSQSHFAGPSAQHNAEPNRKARDHRSTPPSLDFLSQSSCRPSPPPANRRTPITRPFRHSRSLGGERESHHPLHRPAHTSAHRLLFLRYRHRKTKARLLELR